MKSGKIAKIGWNCVKTRFHHRFNAFSKENKMWIIVPSSSRCQAIIGLLHTQNKSKVTFSVFSFSQPSKFQQSTIGPPPITLFFYFSIIDDVFFINHREIQISDNNSGVSLVSTSHRKLFCLSFFTSCKKHHDLESRVIYL
jgi:hypothetical protein